MWGSIDMAAVGVVINTLCLVCILWPFTLEHQQEKAAEMIDKGKRVKLTHRWYGWRVAEIKEYGAQ